MRDAVEALLVRAQQAGEVRTEATVDEVYVLIGALAAARGPSAVVDGAVNLALSGLSPLRTE